jgi:hypothetical protein
MTMPSQPVRRPIPREHEHFALHEGVKRALLALPLYFKSETSLRGIAATDIFTLNDTLGATIENQVVANLNAMRAVWDPEGRYADYGFLRQAQTFPDVLLKSNTPATRGRPSVLLGIELKGWYILSKEGEPSFRYCTTPGACADHDLLVVVPWVLNDVLSGTPIVFPPLIESAKYAAEMRNYYWSHVRNSAQSRDVIVSAISTPYPAKGDEIADKPAYDSGSNFGRLARVKGDDGIGFMDPYVSTVMSHELAGIPAQYWLRFFKAFTDGRDQDDLGARISRLAETIEESTQPNATGPRMRLRSVLVELEGLNTEI